MYWAIISQYIRLDIECIYVWNIYTIITSMDILWWLYCILALIVWCVIYKIIEKFSDMLFGRFVKEKVSNNKQKFYRNFSLRTIMSEVYLRNLFCEN